MTQLGFGCMRLPQHDGKIDTKTFSCMADRFLSSGFDLFDTAYTYHNGLSETALHDAVVRRYPRTSFRIADKLPLWLVSKKDDLWHIVKEQQQRLEIDYFDRYLLHNLNPSNFDLIAQYNAFQFLSELKERGIAKEIGFSFHSTADDLARLLDKCPNIDFVQLQINYLDWNSPTVQAKACCEIANQANLPITVMEPVRGGSLSLLPNGLDTPLKALDPNQSNTSWAMRFAANCPGVTTVLSGMSAMDHLEDNLKTFTNMTPLQPKELEAIQNVCKDLEKQKLIPCTKCGYCKEKCPQGIPIPEAIALLNQYKLFGSYPYSQRQYYMLGKKKTPVHSCVQCGACKGLCPQHLDVPSFMEQCVSLFAACQNT